MAAAASPSWSAVQISIGFEQAGIGPAAFQGGRVAGADTPPAVAIEGDQSGDDAGHGEGRDAGVAWFDCPL